MAGRTGLVLLALTRLAARFAVALREARFTGRLRRPAVRVVRVARIAFALTRLIFLQPPGFSPQ
jgi:hypothetical protein